MTESNATEKKPSASEKVVSPCLACVAIEIPIELSRDYGDGEEEEAIAEIVPAVYASPVIEETMAYLFAAANRIKEKHPDVKCYFTPCVDLIEKEPI